MLQRINCNYQYTFYFITLIGNTNLKTWSSTSLRRAGLCEDHFSLDSFNPKSVTKRLKIDAVPIPFDLSVSQNNSNESNRKRINFNETEPYVTENITRQSPSENSIMSVTPISKNIIVQKQILQEPPLKTYKPANLHFHNSVEEEDIMEWVHLEPPMHEKISTIIVPDNENNESIEKNKEKNKTKKVKNLNSKIKSLQSEVNRLRNQVRCLKFRLRVARQFRMPKKSKQKKKILNKLIHEQDLHPVAKAMINLQLHTRHAPYTQEEKNLSRQLYYYSPSAFCRLRKAGCNFPGQRTIKMWLEEYDIKPGFCDFIFQKLKDKISHIPLEERVCALKWDEMSIKSYEEYSLKLDHIEGLVDLGHLGRKFERAKCVFVFCLDSLNAHHPWHQPLAYFLPGKCMKAEEIVTLVKECLDRLKETGVDVQLLTCDQGTSNQSAYAQLGINAEKPYFTHNGKEYNASFDFPHLIKRLASFLRTHTNIYCDGKTIASYSDFEMTWSIDNVTKGSSNLLSHITEAHIYPNNFEAMNVKRTFQLFSHTFAAAIKIADHEKELNT